jgi:hypothetical protein
VLLELPLRPQPKELCVLSIDPAVHKPITVRGRDDASCGHSEDVALRDVNL